MAKIMNVTEIESAISSFQNTYPDLCLRIELPEATYEGRTCHALRIGKTYGADKPAILILGGVHAREWGGPDIVVNFASDLMRAYSAGKGLKYGKKSYTADEIKTIVETKTVVVFPCVNPDGVEFSHKKTHLWRKNRNAARAKGNKKKIGVDINRNFDFLWDFKKHFHPAAWADSLASDDPAIETYHGPKPFSEAETRNIKWLLDNFNFSVFLDLHSYAGDVLFSWGNDEDQTTDPDQNFLNPTYDGIRGRIGDKYREYLSPADYETATTVAQTVADAMRAVRKRPYKPLQAVGLYPTSGASDDYAFSRHIAHPGLPKTFGFTVEFNFDDEAKDPFFATAQPKVLDNTIRDVVPGLIALCLSVPISQPILARRPAEEPGASPYGAYRTPLGVAIGRLLHAYEAIASVPGSAGDAARAGLLKAIRMTADGGKPGGGR